MYPWRNAVPLAAAAVLCLLLAQLWAGGLRGASTRRLQFEAMFDNPAAAMVGGSRGGRKGKGKGKGKAVPRPQGMWTCFSPVNNHICCNYST